jgi:hypothetical protein
MAIKSKNLSAILISSIAIFVKFIFEFIGWIDPFFFLGELLILLMISSGSSIVYTTFLFIRLIPRSTLEIFYHFFRASTLIMVFLLLLQSPCRYIFLLYLVSIVWD